MYATWIASAIAVFLGIGAFVYLSRWLRVQHEPGQVPPVDQEGFVKWLQGYERWYHKASFNNHLIFNICRVVPITLGFGIAVISSLPNSVWDTEYVIKNVLVVVLTGISTVTGAVVSQLRIGCLLYTSPSPRD